MNRETPASEEPVASEAAHLSSVSAAAGRRGRAASASVVAGRLVLLLVAALALAAAIALTRARDRDHERAQQSAIVYLCPMHPEVVSPVPGDCPICGMALERGSSAPQAPPADSPTSHRIAEVGRRTISHVIRAAAWAGADGMVTAVLYQDELAMLAPGAPALFFPRATPAAGRRVRLSPEAATAWDATTVKAHFRMEDAAHLEPTTGWLELAARPRDLLIVPESAVLYSGEGAYVLAAPAGGHTFTRRTIAMGRILGSGYVGELSSGSFGAVVVLAGLEAGERVVAADTFFLDAERRLQAAQGKAAEVIE